MGFPEIRLRNLLRLKTAVPIGTAVCLLSCADLDVANLNEPDLERVRSEVDVLALISGSFNTWFNGVYSAAGPGTILSNAAFQNNGPWANNGEELYGQIPRVSIINEVTTRYYSNVARVWYWSYRANGSATDGLRTLESQVVVSELAPGVLSQLKAFGKFMQGLSHATIALLYDRGFTFDEDTDLSESQEPLRYPLLMESALEYFDDAIRIAGSNDFTIPFAWMQADLSAQDLVRVIHSYKARFRAQAARTPEERAALDWDSILADIDAGIQSDFEMYMDWQHGWDQQTRSFLAYPYGSSLTYFMFGMADQGGNVAEWISLPLAEKSFGLPDGSPVLIVTPDLRFPQGTSVGEQQAAPGTHFRIMEVSEVGNTWKAPNRGTWRWSWYKAGNDKGLRYALWEEPNAPEISLAEMRLLKAEALFRKGDLEGAAEIINETRALSGLNPTDASGSNTSCVPRLPDGTCGDLWEMLKWEKRMEVFLTGVAGANWYFDARGWGDLWRGTPLHFPVPCQELQAVQLTPCNDVGGPGGLMGSPGSTYHFPGEG